MPRVARIVLTDTPHHVTQRGNNRQDVFFTSDDRVAYLRLLAKNANRFGLSILAYCLMTNHVHLIVVPKRADSLAKALGRTHFMYSQFVNRLHKRSGHLWQNRFFSCPLGSKHAADAARYVEQNPLRAKLRKDPVAWPWSSAKAHVSGIDPTGLLDMEGWREIYRGEEWERELRRKLDPTTLRDIRTASHTGRPLAGDSWLAKLETKLGRRLRPLAVGRPRGKKDAKKRKKGAQK